MLSYKKYPRTFHLPWSPGSTSDDKVLKTIDHFFGSECVITEKLDGESTSIYSNGYFHARSIDGNKHPSQSKMKAFAASLNGLIDDNTRLMGENLSAFHTVVYDELPHFFFLFGVGNGDVMESWDTVEEYAQLISVPTVPVLWRGVLTKENHKEIFDMVNKMNGTYCKNKEGYVIRKVNAFNIGDFKWNFAKYVSSSFKADFDEDTHWRNKAVVWNKIKTV